MQLFKEFTFDSAHFLPHVPDGHKCKTMHGHTYRMVLYLEGALVQDLDWVMDFADLKNAVQPVIDIIDHNVLNDIPGLENPTCERIAKWLWEKIKPGVPLLAKIELYETPSAGVIYTGK